MRTLTWICAFALLLAGCRFDPAGVGSLGRDGGSDSTPLGCGNGVVEAGEECDDGQENSDGMPNVCRTSCLLPFCGDGVQDDGEECDYGEANSDTEPDMCRTDCRLPYCGDAVEDNLEECDHGQENSDTVPNTCREDCTSYHCGDGVIDIGEQCDDGAENDDTVPDACRTDCQEAHCGDSVLDSGEQCDDGNLDEGDGCSSTCISFPIMVDDSAWSCFEEDISDCDDPCIWPGCNCTENDSLHTCSPQQSEGCIDGSCVHIYSGNSGYCGLGGVRQTVTVPDAPGVVLYAKIDTSCDQHAGDGGIIVDDGTGRKWLVAYHRTDVSWQEHHIDLTDWRGQTVTLEIAVEDQSDSWCNASDHSYELRVDLLELRQL
jgi:cysteine-rich repeat protein